MAIIQRALIRVAPRVQYPLALKSLVILLFLVTTFYKFFQFVGITSFRVCKSWRVQYSCKRISDETFGYLYKLLASQL